jgi:Ser/Thr protein kinase RdoA (MazF antagonist)
MLQLLLNAYGLRSEQVIIEAFGSGLINNTWTVKDGDKKYILQRINTNVFKEPGSIAANIELIASYLKKNYPTYEFVAPVAALNGRSLIYHEGEGYFRMFRFVEGSHTIDVVKTPEQAYEAASQFGRFTRLLDEIDVSKLKITIPDFHNLSLRYRQFLAALENGNPIRKKEAASLIEELLHYSSIVAGYEKIITDKSFIKRVTHHDTKISNVLFDENDKGICVIDLDTVMPGYFISDLGDMMRTYLSPVSEEERDFRKIEIREDFYEAVVNGYYNEMKDVLTKKEKDHFFYAGTFMIYMQALRFLTDYLNNDVYYGEKYPGHNLIRAGNQALLLQRLFEKKNKLTGNSKIEK